MPQMPPAEIIPPRFPDSPLLPAATDEHLDYVAAVLDDIFRIPGTRIRFGLDAIVGLIPGIGDLFAGIASFVIVLAAWRRRVPRVTLVRMITNVLLETTLGVIPVVGDVFHVIWKSNRRNFRLLMREKYRVGPTTETWRDWLFLAFVTIAVIVVIALPLALLWWLFSHAQVNLST
jgi:hypothetical protein